MNDRTELFTVGQLARRTGLSARTIRFWSDHGVVPPTGRSAGGYRLYDAAALARLELVRTLRELGLDLDTVSRVVSRQASVADVARAHVRALDAEIRVLQVRRAVLRSVAERSGTTEEMRLMHKLARLSARERQRLLDDFVDEVFAGADRNAPVNGMADAMRQLPDLPEHSTTAQVDAWVELAELASDEDFRRRVRQMVEAGAAAAPPFDPAPVMQHAQAALDAGVDPTSPQGQEVLGRILDQPLDRQRRAELADQVDTFTDRRVERYWQLLGILHGRPPFPPNVPAFEWFIAALRG